MAATKKIAIVTGANKGIGYAIVKGLCEKFEGDVYLTARNVTRGEAAAKKLKELGYKPRFHQLDVDDEESVNEFRDYIKKNHGGVDLLINNAAIYETKPEIVEQVRGNLRTNYYGLLRVCEAFFPLLRENARVINISSSSGHLSRIPSVDLRKKFSDPELTVAKLDKLMKEFVKSAEDGTLKQNGWTENSYSVSKVGVSALTRIQQRNLDAESPNRNILVNSVHPGYVMTDMTNDEGILTIEEGASAPLYLALQPHGLKGQYVWSDSTLVDWLADSYPSKGF